MRRPKRYYSNSKTTTDFPGILTSSLLSESFFAFLNSTGATASGFSTVFTVLNDASFKTVP